jgi:hypothetical protein
MGPELLERSDALPGMLVPGPGVSAPDGIGLRGNILSELHHKLLQPHYRLPS